MDVLTNTAGDLVVGILITGWLVGIAVASRALARLHRRRLDVVRRNTAAPRHAAPSNVRIIPAQRAR